MGGRLRAGCDGLRGGTLGLTRSDGGMDRGVSGSGSSSVVTSKFSVGSVGGSNVKVGAANEMSGSVGASSGAGSSWRSEGMRARGCTEPGETGGGTRDGRVGFVESRSMDEGGDSERGESKPSLIMGIGLMESPLTSPGGGSGLEMRAPESGLGRGGMGEERRPSGRTLGKRGFGGGLLRGP